MAIAGTIPEVSRPGAPVYASGSTLAGVSELRLEEAAGYLEPPNRFDGECERRGCSEDAAVLVEGHYYCIGCADDLLDRALAIELYPGVREYLPAFEER